jgi:streptogramin lyase
VAIVIVVWAIQLPSPADGDRWALAPEGSFIVVIRRDVPGVIDGGGGYSIEAHDAAGELMYRRTYQGDPIRVAADAWAPIHARVAASLMRTDTSLRRSQAIQQARQQLPIPEHSLPIDAIFIDIAGRIWLHRSDLNCFRVLDGRSGAELAHLRLPQHEWRWVGPATASENALWLLEEDGVGIRRLARYPLDLRQQRPGACSG